MDSIEGKFNLYLPLLVPVPGRENHILVYKTESHATISMELLRSHSRGISIFGNIGEITKLMLAKALRTILHEGFPEPFELKVTANTESKCFTPSIIVGAVAQLIELGSSVYEESFSQDDKDEIIEGLLSERLKLHYGIGILISRAMRASASLIGSPASGSTEFGSFSIHAKPYGVTRISANPFLDEGTSDLLAKLNSYVLVQHYLSVKDSNELRRRTAERGINAAIHFLYGTRVPSEGVLSPDSRTRFCLYKIGEERR
jgi:hypothetical protein